MARIWKTNPTCKHLNDIHEQTAVANLRTRPQHCHAPYSAATVAAPRCPTLLQHVKAAVRLGRAAERRHKRALCHRHSGVQPQSRKWRRQSGKQCPRQIGQD